MSMKKGSCRPTTLTKVTMSVSVMVRWWVLKATGLAPAGGSMGMHVPWCVMVWGGRAYWPLGFRHSGILASGKPS
jgi:hypothetical protein